MQDKDGTSSFPLPQALLVGAREPEGGRGLSKSALFFCAMPQRYLAFCVLVGALFTLVVTVPLAVSAGHRGPSVNPDASHVLPLAALFPIQYVSSKHHGWPWNPGSIVHSCNSYPSAQTMEKNAQSSSEPVPVFDNFDIDLVVKVLSHTAFSKSCDSSLIKKF